MTSAQTKTGRSSSPPRGPGGFWGRLPLIEVATHEVAMRMNDVPLPEATDDDPPDGCHEPALILLGGFSLSCRGRTVPLTAPAQRLLALLALSPTLLDRERAAERLWPALPPERGRGNLRNALWRLRQGCPAIVLEASVHLGLSPAVRVDVRDLTHLARRLDEAEDRSSALLDVDAGGLLVELLPGWQEEWLMVERDRLHSVSLHTLELLALHRAAAGRAVEALDAAYMAVRADPLRESAVSTLIRVHLTQGNRIEALRAYTAFCKRARKELGISVEPMPEIQEYLAEAFRNPKGVATRMGLDGNQGDGSLSRHRPE